jgi:hypothetical protein
MDKLSTWIKAERGRLSKLAAHLNITAGAITQWSIVPADKLVAVEAFTSIPRQDLRPDLFEGMRESAA